MAKKSKQTVNYYPNLVSNLSSVRALVFDLEGVIIDTELIWDLAQAEVLERYGVAYVPQEVKAQLTGLSGLESSRRLVDYYQLQENPKVLERIRYNRVRELMATKLFFIQGFIDFFNMVRTMYYCGVLTSISRSLFNVADASLSILELFEDRVFLMEELGKNSKLDSSAFELCAKIIQVPPSGCLVIEDSPNGIIGGKGAGMSTVGLTTTFQCTVLANADFVVDTFDEILGLLGCSKSK